MYMHATEKEPLAKVHGQNKLFILLNVLIMRKKLGPIS